MVRYTNIRYVAGDKNQCDALHVVYTGMNWPFASMVRCSAEYRASFALAPSMEYGVPEDPTHHSLLLPRECWQSGAPSCVEPPVIVRMG